MRAIVLVLLLVCMSSSVFALGILQIDDVSIDVGDQETLKVEYKNDMTARKVFVEVEAPSGVLVDGAQIAKSSSSNLGSNELGSRNFQLKGVVPGTYVVRASVVEDLGNQTGLGMALKVSSEFKVRVGGIYVNTTNTTSGGSSSGSGGGGGGGGGGTASTNTTPSCDGKYELQAGKWVCVPRKQNDSKPVETTQPVVATSIDQGGDGSFAQGVVPEVPAESPKRPIEETMRTVTDAVKQVVPGRGLLIFILCIGVISITLMGIAYVLIRRSDAL